MTDTTTGGDISPYLILDIDSPPIAPDDPRETPALTADQWRFLWMHERHNVMKWVWLFGETMLRAFTDRGFTATLSRIQADELVHAGLMEWGMGCADIRLTAKGKQVAK